jgi:hypothetical protein
MSLEGQLKDYKFSLNIRNKRAKKKTWRGGRGQVTSCLKCLEEKILNPFYFKPHIFFICNLFWMIKKPMGAPTKDLLDLIIL